MENNEILKISNITKNFTGVRALNDVTMSLLKGEIHAIVGENGAGKSTLCKIVCGVYGYDKGSIIFNNVVLPNGDPQKIKELGISMIPQELGLLPKLTVLQNIFLGNEKGRAGIIDTKKSIKISNDILSDIGIKLNLNTEIARLSLDQQQFVALARVLATDAKLIIFDEPTSTLSSEEANNLFNIINQLKKKGITIVYISHRLEEIFSFADRVTVLKDGVLVSTEIVKKTNKEEIIIKMVGRELLKTFPEKSRIMDKVPVLRLENLTLKNKLKNISFEAYKGEILGIGGLVGMGQVDLVNVIFGNEKITSGSIFLNERLIKSIDPSKAIKIGINFLSSDRRGDMLFMNRSVKENISIGTLKYRQKMGFINMKSEKGIVNNKIKELNIITPNIEQEVQFLSGGNQQKIILSRCLIKKPEVLLLDEPTQGIDVGAKEEFYRVIRQLADEGLTIIVIFSDMIELLGMSDRILVMHEGKISAILNSEEASEEKIIKAASGLKTKTE